MIGNNFSIHIKKTLFNRSQRNVLSPISTLLLGLVWSPPTPENSSSAFISICSLTLSVVCGFIRLCLQLAVGIMVHHGIMRVLRLNQNV